ncbi:hypothetical protein [Aeoliella sp.]|uniref:hypothetical protein n=1 Tax=Aeoliella sp. TaxID=2795800 RepID=UPI003CCBEE8E
MTRERWLPHLQPYLQPANDPELATAGVMQPKPAFQLTFLLPYASVTAFPDNFVNVSDETCLILLVADHGHETVHKVSWGNIGTISIQFSEQSRREARQLSREIIKRRL